MSGIPKLCYQKVVLRCINTSANLHKKKYPWYKGRNLDPEEKETIAKIIKYDQESHRFFGPITGTTDKRSIRKSQSK